MIDPDIESDPLLDDDETVTDPVEDTPEEAEEPDAAPAEGTEETPPPELTGPQATRPKQTAQDRIRKLIADRDARDAELQRYRNHVLEMQQRQQPPPAPPKQEDPNVLRERLEQMGDVERIMWLQQQNAQQQAMRDQQFNLQLQIQNDRIAFDRYVTANPDYERYTAQVEDAFHKGLQAGRPQSREEILDRIIGKEAREKRATAMAKATKAGQQRIQQQTTRPVGTRSNVSSGSTKTALSAEETLRKRLEGGEYNL